LISSAKIIIHSMECFRVEGNIGEKFDQELKVVSQRTRCLGVYSSDNAVIDTTQRNAYSGYEGTLIQIKANAIQPIQLTITPREEYLQKHRVNVVDFNTKELIQEWLFEVVGKTTLRKNPRRF